MAKTNLRVVEKPESKVKGDIDEFNLDLDFIEAVIDVLQIADSDEFNRGTLPALAHEARNKIERINEFTNSIWDVAKEAGIVNT